MKTGSNLNLFLAIGRQGSQIYVARASGSLWQVAASDSETDVEASCVLPVGRLQLALAETHFKDLKEVTVLRLAIGQPLSEVDLTKLRKDEIIRRTGITPEELELLRS